VAAAKGRRVQVVVTISFTPPAVAGSDAIVNPASLAVAFPKQGDLPASAFDLLW